MLGSFRLPVVSLVFAVAATAQVSVLTQHDDNLRTGQNLNEYLLTPSNVNTSTFGRLFTVTVDGKVDAQPLYLAGLTISGNGTHNVLFVASEHDSLYAFDADTGVQLWMVSLLKAGETTSDTRGCGQVSPEIGITSTPVIDPSAGPHGTIYVVAMSKDGSGNYHQRLHALDITNHAEQFGGPVDIAATYPGTGDNSSSGNVVFDPKQYKERAGLLLLNGIVYTSWTSHCDIRPYTGWIMGYDKNTLAQVTVLNITPNGNEGSIWSAGAGPAADAFGNIYFLAANGTFDTTLTQAGFPSKGDYGNAIMKLSTTNNSLAVADYFNMYNTVSESGMDEDLGSGGALALPDQLDSLGHVKHLVIGAGKDKNIYLADRDNMGKFNPSNNSNIYQELPGALAGQEFAMPAYFNNTIYYGSVGDSIRAFPLTNAKLPSSPTSVTAHKFPYPGTTPAISASGSTNGIVWAADNSNPAILYAFDATNLATELFDSNQNQAGRDHFGTGNKFITPTIANGKVYVGTTTGVGVFGLLGQPSADSISPNSGTGSPQTFTMSYSDPAGASNLNATYVVFAPFLTSANVCEVIYSKASNLFYLVNDGGSGVVSGSLAPGASGTLSNSQCTLTGPATVTPSGNSLAVTAPLTFNPSFSGQKTIYMLATNNQSKQSGWQIRGTWTGVMDQAPSAVSVNPSSGSGASPVFMLTYSDPNGYTDIGSTYVLLNSSLSGTNGCLAAYVRSSNLLYLFNDAGSALVAGSVTPGAQGSLSNTQCTVNGPGSIASGSGMNLTLNVSITLLSGFGGTKSIYGLAVDNEGLNSGWRQLGTWARSPDQAPTAVSIAPPSGSGAIQPFSLTYADPDGTSDLATTYALFNATLSGTSGCLIAYSHTSNLIYLFNDFGSGLVSGALTPGMSGTLSNTQCMVSSGGPATTSGSSLTLPVTVIFASPAFSGDKNAYLLAVDNSGMSSGWVQLGTWTVP